MNENSRTRAAKFFVSFVVAAALAYGGLIRNGPRAHAAPGPLGVAPAVGATVQVIGVPSTFGNVTVFPITATNQTDIGPVMPLAEALKRNEAIVREVGAGNVGSLAIQNKSKVSIFVLAGSVVKGGKQDRQIGQDFIIESGKTVTVDAFCVEHGRWTTQRNGTATGGRFDSSDNLATSKVRAAGQYKKNQSEVWSNVGATNAVHGKHAPSSTLTATLDAKDIVEERTKLAAQIRSHLDQVTPANDTIGFAYAIDGQVQSVRWFANHSIWAAVEGQLVNAAAVDSITARAHRKSKGLTNYDGKETSSNDVSTFIADVAKAPVQEERSTQGANVNEYKESTKAYGSKTHLKGRNGKGAEVSSDYVGK